MIKKIMVLSILTLFAQPALADADMFGSICGEDYFSRSVSSKAASQSPQAVRKADVDVDYDSDDEGDTITSAVQQRQEIEENIGKSSSKGTSFWSSTWIAVETITRKVVGFVKSLF
tara:strand:+ start:6275 stop:6622 length:348 start_codon:yes stop_codon:yes gene_type:complete